MTPATVVCMADDAMVCTADVQWFVWLAMPVQEFLYDWRCAVFCMAASTDWLMVRCFCIGDGTAVWMAVDAMMCTAYVQWFIWLSVRCFECLAVKWFVWRSVQ